MFAIHTHSAQPFSNRSPFHSPSQPALASRDPNACFFSTPTHSSFGSKISSSRTFSKMSSTASTSPSICASRAATASPKPRPSHTRGSKFATLEKDLHKPREQRRKEYLSKVQDARDEKRLLARGEQGLRMEWLAERRAWWQEREREGEGYVGEIDEEEDSQHDGEMEEVNVLDLEEQMLDAMALEAEHDDEMEQEMTDYGSDDDEYEKMMLDIAMQAESSSQAGPTSSAMENDHGMDLS